ncbi:MAG: hypothetical protein LBP39_00165 [Rickettsiales bacterium]|nr:hypothetical protein [Rickettsiales bacterium]
MQSIELSIGTNRAFIEYHSELEKELFQKTARELNIEYNKLTINCGKIDENILLFFLLMKIEIKLQKISYHNVDDMLPAVFKSIGKYVQEKNGEKIKEALMVIGIIKKMELNKMSDKSGEDDDRVLAMIKKFSDEIKDGVTAIENNILLS